MVRIFLPYTHTLTQGVYIVQQNVSLSHKLCNSDGIHAPVIGDKPFTVRPLQPPYMELGTLLNLPPPPMLAEICGHNGSLPTVNLTTEFLG